MEVACFPSSAVSCHSQQGFLNWCWEFGLLDPLPCLCFGLERVPDVQTLREPMSGCSGSAARLTIKWSWRLNALKNQCWEIFHELLFKIWVVLSMPGHSQAALEHCNLMWLLWCGTCYVLRRKSLNFVGSHNKTTLYTCRCTCFDLRYPFPCNITAFPLYGRICGSWPGLLK